VDAVDLTPDPLVAYQMIFSGLKLVPRAATTRWAAQTANWKRRLADVVGNYMGLQSSFRGGCPVWTWYGHKSDVELAIELYDICAAQINAASRAHCRVVGAAMRAAGRWWDNGASKAEGVTFKQGAVRGLAHKLQRLKRASIADVDHAEANALILSRERKVSDWVNTNYTFKVVNNAFANTLGWSREGYEAGQALNLRKGKHATLPGKARSITSE